MLLITLVISFDSTLKLEVTFELGKTFKENFNGKSYSYKKSGIPISPSDIHSFSCTVTHKEPWVKQQFFVLAGFLVFGM